jgi:hypothetical protein
VHVASYGAHEIFNLLVIVNVKTLSRGHNEPKNRDKEDTYQPERVNPAPPAG